VGDLHVARASVGGSGRDRCIAKFRGLLFHLLDSFVRNRALDQVDRSLGGVVFLDIAACGIGLARTENHLEALGWVVLRTILEDRGERVAVFAPVVPCVDSAASHHRTGKIKTGKPGDGVDLVAHPLAGDAGRVGPKQAELKVFARIKRHLRPV